MYQNCCAWFVPSASRVAFFFLSFIHSLTCRCHRHHCRTNNPVKIKKEKRTSAYWRQCVDLPYNNIHYAINTHHHSGFLFFLSTALVRHTDQSFSLQCWLFFSFAPSHIHNTTLKGINQLYTYTYVTLCADVMYVCEWWSSQFVAFTSFSLITSGRITKSHEMWTLLNIIILIHSLFGRCFTARLSLFLWTKYTWYILYNLLFDKNPCTY